MAPQRPSKVDTTTDAYAVQGGGGAGADRSYDVSQKLGSIQQSVIYLEAASNDLRKEVNDVSKRMTSAEATFKTLQWVLGIVGSVIVILWAFIASIVTMAVKHYLGW